MSADDKPLVWLHGEVRTPPFSREARLEAGFLLRRLQQGHRLAMPQSRPMPAVGVRCHELRIVDSAATWRIVYRTDPDAIVIGEVFSKKTAATPRAVIGRYASVDFGSTTMRDDKRKRLEARGWKVGTTRDFLDLTPDEEAYVELRLRLAHGLKQRRLRRNLTQTEFAKVVRSSQSRVAKMEIGDPTVSLDLLIRSLLALGASRKDVAKLIAGSGPLPAT
jgi:phage-related protein